MKDIQINHFKAYKDQGIEVHLDSDQTNLLLLGENGSGKTSLCEALKLFFYTDKYIDIPPHFVGEEREAHFQTALNQYKNATEPNQSIEISIDSHPYTNAAAYLDDHTAFFVGANELRSNDDLSLDRLLQNVYFPASVISADAIVHKYWKEEFVAEVNGVLENDFYEKVRISLAEGEGHSFELQSPEGHLKYATNLHTYFNEALIHLVVLVILLKIVEKSKVDNQHHVLVLDDIITSLDACNRGLITRYVITKLRDFQKVILTHNVSYYNLFNYTRNTLLSPQAADNHWQRFALYVYRDVPTLSPYLQEKKVDKFKQDLREALQITPVDLEPLGNKIRKHFEHLLHEYASLVQFGDFYETRAYLDGLISCDKDLYLCSKDGRINDIHALVKEIKSLVYNEQNPRFQGKLQEKLKQLFCNYNCNDTFVKVRDVLRDLQMLQKVVLHPLSHVPDGGTTFTYKEMEVVLHLLEKLEKVVDNGKKMTNTGNVYQI